MVGLSAGNFSIPAGQLGPNVVFTGGQFVGSNIISGTLTWDSGTWNGSEITISSNSVLATDTGNNHGLANGTLNYFASVLWLAGQVRGGGGAGTLIENYGLWDMRNDGNLQASEPAIPFGLGILVKNTGLGVANDFTTTSAKPKIIANSDGLAIAFQITDSQVDAHPTLSPSLTLDLEKRVRRYSERNERCHRRPWERIVSPLKWPPNPHSFRRSRRRDFKSTPSASKFMPPPPIWPWPRQFKCANY